MDGGSFWLSIAALLLAVPTAVVAVAGYLHSRRAIQREQEDRREQLELLRAQLEASEADRLNLRAARLTAMPGPAQRGDLVDTYRFDVENHGPDVAQALVARAVDRHGAHVAQSEPWPAIKVGGRWPVLLEIPTKHARSGGLRLHVGWEDGAGLHDEDLGAIDPIGRARTRQRLMRPQPDE